MVGRGSPAVEHGRRSYRFVAGPKEKVPPPSPDRRRRGTEAAWPTSRASWSQAARRAPDTAWVSLDACSLELIRDHVARAAGEGLERVEEEHLPGRARGRRGLDRRDARAVRRGPARQPERAVEPDREATAVPEVAPG